jgi:hypothetical protein
VCVYLVLNVTGAFTSDLVGDSLSFSVIIITYIPNSISCADLSVCDISSFLIRSLSLSLFTFHMYLLFSECDVHQQQRRRRRQFPDDECKFYYTFCIPVSKFESLPRFGVNPSTLNETEWDELSDAIVKFIDDLHVFATGLPVAIARTIFDDWDHVARSKYIGVTMAGDDINVQMLSVGAVIRDISNIDYIGGYFTVDLRLYVKKITYGEPYWSVKDAVDVTWTTVNQSSLVVKHCLECNESFSTNNWLQYLPEDYDEDTSQVGPDDRVIQDGSCTPSTFNCVCFTCYALHCILFSFSSFVVSVQKHTLGAHVQLTIVPYCLSLSYLSQ